MINKPFLNIETKKKGLQHFTEFEQSATYSEKKREILRLIKDKKDFTPLPSMKVIRQISFKIKKKVTIDKIVELGFIIEERYGIECFQISVDRKTNMAYMLFNWILPNGEPFVLNSSIFRRFTVLVLDFLELPRPKETKNWERWFLAEKHRKDENIFEKQIDILVNSKINGLNYTLVIDALLYADKVCQGIVK